MLRNRRFVIIFFRWILNWQLSCQIWPIHRKVDSRQWMCLLFLKLLVFSQFPHKLLESDTGNKRLILGLYVRTVCVFPTEPSGVMQTLQGRPGISYTTPNSLPRSRLEHINICLSVRPDSWSVTNAECKVLLGGWKFKNAAIQRTVCLKLPLQLN